jgi:glycosyltransferase involved in cell wall biosynthesis
MRIGIDATNLNSGWAGLGQYVSNLARSLSEVDRENQYFIFARPKIQSELKIKSSNFQFVNINQPYRPLRLAWEQYGLPLQVKRRGIDILHSPHYTMPVIPSCKTVVTFHDMTYKLHPELHRPFHRHFFPRMMNWSARHADQLITVSESTRTDAIRLIGVDPNKVTSIPLAASEQYRQLQASDVKETCARYNLIPGQFLCYVGVLEPRKDVPLLIKAYSKIADSINGMPLVIIGKKGWMFDEIFRQITDLGLEKQIKIPGYVSTSDLVGLYNGAKVFVYPSRYEGFGLPILEAMQCGTPVITTNISSMPEVAGGAAVLITPGNVDELVAAMRKVLTDPGLAESLSRKGIARASDFSWRRCARETLQVYKTVYEQ